MIGARRVCIFLALVQDLDRAVEAGDGLGELRADIHDLEDRRDHEGQQHGVLEVAAGGHLMIEHLVAAEQHHQSADNAQHRGGSKATARWWR